MQFAQINLVPRTNIFVTRIGPRTNFQAQLSSDSLLPPQVSHCVVRDGRQEGVSAVAVNYRWVNRQDLNSESTLEAGEGSPLAEERRCRYN